jgi:hypothetical protein
MIEMTTHAEYFVDAVNRLLSNAAAQINNGNIESAREMLARAEGYLECAMDGSLINHHTDGIPLQAKVNDLTLRINTQ